MMDQEYMVSGSALISFCRLNGYTLMTEDYNEGDREVNFDEIAKSGEYFIRRVEGKRPWIAHLELICDVADMKV